MTESEKITKLAEALIEIKSNRWMYTALGMNYNKLNLRLARHNWLVDEATIIRKYHELFIEKLEEAGQ